MDSINDLISSVMSNPESLAKLRDAAGQLGLHVPDESQADTHGISDGMNALAPAISKLTPLLGKLSEEDDMTRLIHALKPYLTGARLKRAEEADRIVLIMRVIPLLRQAGQEQEG